MKSTLLSLLLGLVAAPVVAQEQVAPEQPAETVKAEADSTSGPFARGQAFTDWDARFWDGDSFNAFVLRRAELGGGWRWPAWGGFFVNFEGVRSAGAESLLGVDGNSFVLRAKHAYAFGEPELGPGKLILEAGLIPDVWITAVEQPFDLRGHDATSSERTGFFETSDLGATVGYSLLDDLVALRVSVTNGEGRNDVELNRGKNTTTVLSTTPIKFTLFGEEARPSLHGGYRDGSLGVGRARNHRVFGALTFDHPRIGLGLEFARAMGVKDDAGLDAQVWGVWVRGEPIYRWLGAFARYEQYDSNLDADSDVAQTIQAGVYSDVLRHEASHIRLYLAGEMGLRDTNAPEVPGVPAATEYQAVRLTIDATGLFDPNRADED